MYCPHTPNQLQNLLSKIQDAVKLHDATTAIEEKDKTNKLDLKKAPKAKEEEAKPHEQDNPVDDEEHRCATDDMGMQNPDKMPKDKDREDVIVQIESKTNEAATDRAPVGFVRFATAEEAFLWEDEILGQLSDGAWENATPDGHWEAWGRADIKVGSPAGYYGFRPKRTSYGLNKLIQYIGERMQTHLGLMRILKAKGVNPSEFVNNQLPDDVESLHLASKYAKQEGKAGDYWSNAIQKWQAWGIDEAMMQKALKDTSEADVRKVLRDIQKTIKVQLPDAGPEKGPEPEKEPELKKEEPKVTEPELKTPRGEPGAKKFPSFSKEGKIPAKPAEADEVVTTKALKEDEADYPPEKPATKMGPVISSKEEEAKPSEAGEEETTKALKEEEQGWKVFDRLEGLADQKRLKQLGSLVQEFLNDFTDEGFEAEDVEEYLLGKVKDIITSQGLAGRKIEGKAPISTDTPEQAKKKLMEEAPAGVDAEQLTMGIKVEMEHTDKPEEAKKIALDHLAEDPKYYTKLKKMEAGKCDDVQLEEAFGPEEEQYKVSEEDLAVLSKAVKAGKLKNAYPSEEDMIDQLSSLEDIVDPATAEEGDVRLLWLKYVQIPKAYALTGPVTAKKSSGIPSAKNLDKQWDSAPYPHKNEAVIGPTFEAETLLKEVLFAMKKYGWNYEEAVKGFAAKNDMDPEELEHLLSKAIETESSSDQPVKEQEEVQYVSVADGILDKKTADDLAVKIKGTVATDDNDPKKFKVITRKDSGTV